MPLDIPPLDARRYDDLVREALARVPVHTPEWTNLGPADPGVTLVELFAFLTESLLYRANQIPERNRLKFLRLLGVPLQPARPAQGLVAIANAKGPARAQVLARDLELRAGSVAFRTTRGVEVLPVEPLVVFKRRVTQPDGALVDYARLLYASFQGGDGSALEPDLYETVALDGRAAVSVDVAAETVDGSLWIALLARETDKPGRSEDWPAVHAAIRRELAGRTLSVGIVPINDTGTRELAPAGAANAEGEPMLRFEMPSVPPGGVLPDDPTQRVAAYRTLDARMPSNPLAQAAVVDLTLPGAAGLELWSNLDPLEPGADDFPPAIADEALDARIVTWLRIRAVGAARARLAWVGINAAPVTQGVHVNGEPLADGTGEPDQTRSLARRPVVAGSVRLLVDANAVVTEWRETDDLLAAPGETDAAASPARPGASTPADVFTLDAEAGTLAFGDGLHGRRPPRGARIRAAYDYSAGAAGNVGKGAINAGTALPAGFTVANPVPTWGGTDAEDVAQGEKQVTRMLQHRDRLVTAADFEAITLRTPGVEVGRVDVLPAFHPDLSPNEPGDAPGVVTLMVLPRRDAAHPDAPEPDGAFLDAICRHLDPRRLVTTELVLRGPRYRDLVISVGVNVVAGFNAGEVVDAVRQRLRQWLAAVGDASLPEVVPIAGTAGNARRRGWPLRTAVTEKELLAEVARVAGVLSVNEVLLAEKGQGEQPQVPMSGLDLPRIVGLAVGVGDPLPLDAVTGVADTAIPAMTRRRIAVPVTPERC